MNKTQQRQIVTSIIAILLCVLFLWTGKKFIWNQEEVPPEDSSVGTDYLAEATASQNTTELSETASTAEAQDTTMTDSDSSGSEGSDHKEDSSAKGTGAESTAAEGSETPAQSVTTASETPAPSAQTDANASSGTPAPAGYFNDALFIGDSRTVGLASYGPISGATYFATVGLAAYKIDSAKNEVGDMKGKSFADVLGSKTYGKIYIMLGLNEIGNNRNSTIQKYDALIQKIKQAQPGAAIVLQANLHVSEAKSASDAVINNAQINSLNASVQQLAEKYGTKWLDINSVFDDGKGNFRADYTHDGVHPVAKYYKTWSEWIQNNI